MPLLFAYGINRFSHDVALLFYKLLFNLYLSVIEPVHENTKKIKHYMYAQEIKCLCVPTKLEDMAYC